MTTYPYVCGDLGCTKPATGYAGYCIEHNAQFWPLWAAHPLDEYCPPDCPTKQIEEADLLESWSTGR